MLAQLSIRDIVLMEKLDISLAPGLTVLTGETGAGKSILLDALGLALGARGDSGLVRTGAAKGVVTAEFSVPADHAVFTILEEQGIDGGGELIVRRIQSADGPSRALVNDQPVSVNLLRRIGDALAEIHGQHADRALVDVANHRRLLDAFAGLEAEAERVADLWAGLARARQELAEHRAIIARAESERAYLEHAAEELRGLDPKPGEESELAETRQIMMNAEQFASLLAEAEEALSGDGAGEARLAQAARKLERRRDAAGGRLDSLCAALDRLLAETGEVHRAIAEARLSFVFDPRALEQSEERLFALRALARKHKCPVDDLARLRSDIEGQLQALSDGGRTLDELERAEGEASRGFMAAARALSRERANAARMLDKAVRAELAPLKLERARFETEMDAEEANPGPNGIDRIEFLVAVNPGTPLLPLMKVASGGELARFMLALKAVLAANGSAPTLIFDEIDTGVGGAAADAIGIRLARLAKRLQVLAVTHSPQVAARADRHFLITKMEEVGSRRMITRVQPLSAQSRREEIARMLSGAQVTDEARAQADRLLSGTG